MTGATQNPYHEFITERIEVALFRCRDNPAYIERCRQQDKSEEVVDSLLEKLKKKECMVIRRHYEGETVKQNFELDETYLQGMRDCIQILSYLDAFHREVQFYE